MTNVGFDRAQEQRVSRASILADGVVNGCGFNWVTNSGSRSMSLDEADVLRIKPSLVVDLAY